MKPTYSNIKLYLLLLVILLVFFVLLVNASYGYEYNYAPQCSSPTPEVPETPTSTSYSYTFEQGIPGIVKKGSSIDSQGLSGLARSIILFAYSIAGILALAMLIYAGVQYTVSAGNATIQKDAQDRIWQAIIGLVLLFSSYIILYTINPQLVRIKEPVIPPLPADGFTLRSPVNPLPGPLPPPLDDQTSQNLWNCINNGGGSNFPSLNNPVHYGDGGWVCNNWVQAMYRCANITDYPIGGATEMYIQVSSFKTDSPKIGDIAFWCKDINYIAGPPESCKIPEGGSSTYNHIGIYIGNGQITQCGDTCPSVIGPNDLGTDHHFMGYFRIQH